MFLHTTQQSRGFTLLEMLLAMMVIAIVGVTLSNAVGGVASQTFTLERRSIAHWVGQNEINRLRILSRAAAATAASGGGQRIPTGKDTSRVTMGQRNWEIRTSIEATDNPWMRRVEVEVYELVGGDSSGPYDTQVAFVESPL